MDHPCHEGCSVMVSQGVALPSLALSSAPVQPSQKYNFRHEYGDIPHSKEVGSLLERFGHLLMQLSPAYSCV